MSRWKAASIHLTLSAAIAIAVVLLMLALWYPPPYFALMGGATLVVLIVGCDVVLGPLMTLIVFRSGKKRLLFDLTTIATLQAAALAYGAYVMFEARPVFTVFAIDRFEVVAANQIPPGELTRVSNAQFASLPLTGPRIAGAVLPTDSKERLDLLVPSMFGRVDIKNLPHLYVPYESVAATAARRAHPLEALERRDAHVQDELVRRIGADAAQPDRLGYLPLVSRFGSMAAIVDRRTGEVQAVLDVWPW